MTTQASQPVFGNPEFRQKAHDKFPKFFEVGLRVNAALNSLTDRAYDNVEPYQRVIINLGMLTGISMTELITLVGNGFGYGAMKIVRGMLDYAINAEYLRRFPAERDYYLNWGWVEQHKLLNYIRENVPGALNQITEENKQKIETEFGRVRHMYEYPNSKGKKRLRGSLCSFNLASRAAKTDFQETYRIINPLASSLMHGTMAGLVMQIDANEDEDRIAVPPSVSYCGEALIGGHLCLVKVVETLAKTFAVKPCPAIERLCEDFHYAWGELSKKQSLRI